MGVIAAAVDHSAGSKAALRFALEEARLRPGFLPDAGGELEDFRQGAAAELDETLPNTRE